MEKRWGWSVVKSLLTWFFANDDMKERLKKPSFHIFEGSSDDLENFLILSVCTSDYKSIRRQTDEQYLKNYVSTVDGSFKD